MPSRRHRLMRRGFRGLQSNVRKRGVYKTATRNYVNRAINRMAEKKQIDEYGVAQEFNDSGSIIDVTTISQGSTDNTRNGDTVRLLNMDLRCNIHVDTAPDKPVVPRLIIFAWKPNSALVAPSVSDILLDTTSNRMYLSPLNTDKRDQFSVIYDSLFSLAGAKLQADATEGDTHWRGQIVKRLYFNQKKLPAKQEYQAGGTDSSNKVYFLLVSNAATGTAAASMDYYCHTQFTDG